jgi:hypothetical protein
MERLCEQSATVADLLANWAALRDDSTSARLATDSLQLVIAAHVLQVDIADALEGEVAE